MFLTSPTGSLVPITGVDARRGEWKHVAFLPYPLPDKCPDLTVRTHNTVADARAALAALGARASLLPNPRLLRRPTLRVEAQSTSALEGTYAPLEDVLGADEEEEQPTSEMREIVNYILAAEYAFTWLEDLRPVTLSLLEDLQARLVRSTAADTDQAGKVRTVHVAIGSRRGGGSRRLDSSQHLRGQNWRRSPATAFGGWPLTISRTSTLSSQQPWATTSSRLCTRSTTAMGGSAVWPWCSNCY